MTNLWLPNGVGEVFNGKLHVGDQPPAVPEPNLVWYNPTTGAW
jgi:hypothetical protein